MDATASQSPLDDRIGQLEREIDRFVGFHRFRHTLHIAMNTAIIVASLSLAASVTLIGLRIISTDNWQLDPSSVSAALGVVISFLIGVQNAFAIGDKGAFHEFIAIEGATLIEALSYETQSDDDFRAVLARFQALRLTAAKSQPRGQGIESLRALYGDASAQTRTARRTRRPTE